MTKLIQTNPAYAALAYRRTVLKHVVTSLRRDHIGLDTEPKEVLICEDVFQVDAHVPIEEVGYVVEDLVEEIEELSLEMSKFEFSKREYVSKRLSKVRKRESQGEKGSGQPTQEKGQGDSKG
jgi:hypothetical protein